MQKLLIVLLLCLAGCGGDALTADQRRAVEAAMELFENADRATVEKRAESWGHKEMAHMHKMLKIKRDQPDQWHAANDSLDDMRAKREGK